METFIVHPKSVEERNAVKAFLKALKIKFEKAEDKSDYNPDFVAMIEQNKKDFKDGKGIKIDLDDIWK